MKVRRYFALLSRFAVLYGTLTSCAPTQRTLTVWCPPAMEDVIGHTADAFRQLCPDVALTYTGFGDWTGYDDYLAKSEG